MNDRNLDPIGEESKNEINTSSQFKQKLDMINNQRTIDP